MKYYIIIYCCIDVVYRKSFKALVFHNMKTIELNFVLMMFVFHHIELKISVISLYLYFILKTLICASRKGDFQSFIKYTNIIPWNVYSGFERVVSVFKDLNYSVWVILSGRLISYCVHFGWIQHLHAHSICRGKESLTRRILEERYG